MRNITVRSMFLAAAGVMLAGAANSADLDITGFVRFEPAIKITGKENPNNQSNFLKNGDTIARDSSLVGGCKEPCTLAGVIPLSTTFHSAPDGRIDSDNEFNNFAGRAEVDFTVNVNQQFTLFSKVRLLGSPGIHDEFGNPDYYRSDLFKGNRGTFLEVSGDNYMADIPALYVDYNNGPLWLRAGNMTIAWGEAYFFRVLDVPNGLDLRRHLTFDFAAEEYSDKRVPAPAIRGSYRVTDTIEAEGFVQMFSPTVLPNSETPYSVVSDGFELKELEFNDDRWAANAGGRMQAQFGDLGVQLIAVNRRNPDGVVKFRASETGSGFPFDASALVPSATRGVQSAAEFAHGAAYNRLNTTEIGNASYRFFPAAQFVTDSITSGSVPAQTAIFGLPVFAGDSDRAGPGGIFPMPGADYTNLTQTKTMFDAFFQTFGSLRGLIERVYPRENIFGAGVNYLIHSDNQYLDQLVVRAEATITPNKKFTNNLKWNFIEEDEVIAAAVMEKYHRFSQAFPATYFVAQYMFRSDSDIFGRHLGGMGGTENMLPTGVDNSHYISFAFQQPFPSLIWRVDFAVLYDVQGGAFFQPAVKWKPREQYTLEMFVNVLESDGGNDDFAQTIDYADEIGIRATLQF